MKKEKEGGMEEEREGRRDENKRKRETEEEPGRPSKIPKLAGRGQFVGVFFPLS
jgi:hypothetical protein